MRFPTLPPPNPLTTICVWIAAIFIAIREGAQKSQILPGLVQAMSGGWSYLPLGVLVLAAIVYLVNWLLPSHGLAMYAEMRIRTQAGGLPPQELSKKNVWRWFMLSIIGQTAATAAQPAQAISVHHTLFISFQRPIGANTVEVSSPDMTLPLHELKDLNARFAIIVFAAALPAGTLVVTVKP